MDGHPFKDLHDFVNLLKFSLLKVCRVILLQTILLYLKFFETKETYLWFVNYLPGSYEN
jgi:hypothetical protein